MPLVLADRAKSKAVVRLDMCRPRPVPRPSNSVLEIEPNNAMALSKKDWLCPAKRASVWVTGGTATGLIRSTDPCAVTLSAMTGSGCAARHRRRSVRARLRSLLSRSCTLLRSAASSCWPLWNALPGVAKRRRVGDRDALIDQLWSAIERLPDPEPRADPKRPSKQDVVIAMLRQPEGATVDEVASVTGWQRHTVRGVFSGALKKKLGLPLASAKEERGRVYRIEPASA